YTCGPHAIRRTQLTCETEAESSGVTKTVSEHHHAAVSSSAGLGGEEGKQTGCRQRGEHSFHAHQSLFLLYVANPNESTGIWPFLNSPKGCFTRMGGCLVLGARSQQQSLALVTNCPAMPPLPAPMQRP